MGCFSLSCVASNLPIYYHKVYVALLKKSKYGELEHGIAKNFVCSNSGSSAYFSFASPLIAAQCDTYGNVQDVEENENFKFTCKLLGIEPSEENFHNWISQDWMEEPSPIGKNEEKYYVVFFRREVVDSILDYTLKNMCSLLTYNQQHWILESFPEIFKFKKEVEGRYSKIYELEDGREIASDGSWIHAITPKNSEYSLFKTADLVKFIKNDGISDKFMNSDKMKEILKGNSIEYEMMKIKKLQTNLFNELGRIPEYMDAEYYDYGLYPFHYSDKIIRAFSQCIALTWYMYSCNRFLWPSFSGPQINDYKELAHLNKLTAKLIKADKDEYDG